MKTFTLSKGRRVGLVCCSDPLSQQQILQTRQLIQWLKSVSILPAESDCLFAQSPADRSPRHRAAELMRFYSDPSIQAILDVSGGDLTNEILPYLDYEFIRLHEKPFWGYSDLTALLNALYQKSGRTSMLYQVRNLVGEQARSQQERFLNSVQQAGEALYQIDWQFLQGKEMQGRLLGGNLRCLLKLAGTPYFPDLNGCLLFLESLGGGPNRIASCLCQLEQMGVFDQISGLLLGTFTKLEEQIGPQETGKMICSAVNRPDLPIAKTQQVGHGPDSRCLQIGALYRCCADCSFPSNVRRQLT